MDQLQTLEIKQHRGAKRSNEYEYEFSDNIQQEIIINDESQQSILRHRNCPSFNNNKNENREKKSKKNNIDEPVMLNYKKNRKQKEKTSFFKETKQQPTGNNENFFTKKQNLYPKHQRAYTVDHISRWTFPLSFVMLNLVYWTYYLEMLDSMGITQLVKNI